MSTQFLIFLSVHSSSLTLVFQSHNLAFKNCRDIQTIHLILIETTNHLFNKQPTFVYYVLATFQGTGDIVIN